MGDGLGSMVRFIVGMGLDPVFGMAIGRFVGLTVVFFEKRWRLCAESRDLCRGELSWDGDALLLLSE